jgi:acyl-CoA thioester hydrolase
MGVAYHTHYLVWCEVGRTDLIRSLGAPYAELEREGLRLAVLDAEVRYHAGARYDDVVRVETRIARVLSRTVTFRYEIWRVEPGPERRLATAMTRLIALDDAGAPRTMPGELVARLSGR